jgi:hypothetical protein
MSAIRRHRVWAALLVAIAIAYLIPFVPRGWVPHDEGMLGQSADRVLHGALPHVDYEEPYTGGLTYLYAGLFRVAGVDLLNVRWLLFVAAAGAAWLTYAVTRYQLPPLGAALATWVAVAWSFPNYFAGLPSWWLLLCALIQLWAMIRWADSPMPRYVVIAALSAGVAMTIKQTGAYLLVALILWALYGGGFERPLRRQAYLETAVRWVAGAAALVFGAVILAPRLTSAEGLYLFAPAAATTTVLFIPHGSAGRSHGGSRVRWAMLAGAVAMLPLALLLLPYGVSGHVRDFLEGALVLPRKRLIFASAPMPSAWWMLTAFPLLAVAALAQAPAGWSSGAATAVAWTAAIALPIAALSDGRPYQLVWQSARALAALLPIVIAWQLVSGRVQDSRKRSMLFATAAVLAWTSINQYPFAAPIYFSYTTPLVVAAAVAAVDASPRLPTRAMLPWATLLVLFAVLITNRGDLYSLGQASAPVRLNVRLRLPRAHLRVGSVDAYVYRQLMMTLGERYHGGGLVAGPDCPEVYFLTGLQSPSGALFDFFSESEPDDVAQWLKAEVVIINHEPQFSPPVSPTLLKALEREFAYGQRIGRFEVRWR